MIVMHIELFCELEMRKINVILTYQVVLLAYLLLPN